MELESAVEYHMTGSEDIWSAAVLPAPTGALGCRVSVVIPTLNEAANLPHVFSRLPTDLHEVILVDGGSKDNTVQVAQALYPGIRVVGQTGRGKGNALACGFAACTGDVIVMLDADGSADPGEIPLFVAALLDGADFAKGSRLAPGGGSADITRFRGAGNAMLTGVVNVLFGTKYSDLCYGYNAFWTHCLPHLDVDCDGFEVETLINIRIARTDLVVREVPSFEHLRIHGSSNLRPVRDGLRCARTIFKERFRSTARSVRVAYDNSVVASHDDLSLDSLEPETAR